MLLYGMRTKGAGSDKGLGVGIGRMRLLSALFLCTNAFLTQASHIALFYPKIQDQGQVMPNVCTLSPECYVPRSFLGDSY